MGETFQFLMRITSKRSFQQVIRNQNVSPFQHTHAKRLEASFTQILISLLLTFFGSFFSVNLFLVQQVKIFFILSCSSSTKKFTVFLNLFLFIVFLIEIQFTSQTVSQNDSDSSPKHFYENSKPYQTHPQYVRYEIGKEQRKRQKQCVYEQS